MYMLPPNIFVVRSWVYFKNLLILCFLLLIKLWVQDSIFEKRRSYFFLHHMSRAHSDISLAPWARTEKSLFGGVWEGGCPYKALWALPVANENQLDRSWYLKNVVSGESASRISLSELLCYDALEIWLFEYFAAFQNLRIENNKKDILSMVDRILKFLGI